MIPEDAKLTYSIQRKLRVDEIVGLIIPIAPRCPTSPKAQGQGGAFLASEEWTTVRDHVIVFRELT
jgi:hypothetical protein